MNRIAGLLFGLLTAVSVLSQDKPDLSGRAIGDDGSPVADASVFIYTAGPRVGPGYI